MNILKTLFSRLFHDKHHAKGHIGKIECRDGVTIVRLKGDITFDTLSSIHHEHIDRFKGADIKNVLADFKDVVNIDTGVIVALVSRLKEMRSIGKDGRIGLINLSDKMRILLDISKTKDLFIEYRSEDAAVMDLSKRG